MWYKQQLDEGRFNTQAELAQVLGVSRSRVASLLRLLKLAPEIQEYIMSMSEADSRLQLLTERRLRSVVQSDGESEQRDRFWRLVRSAGN